MPTVIAAGGLGTRAAGWSPYLPKEFRPVQGRPGLAHVVDEIGTAGSERAVLVHHDYYSPLVAWTAQVLKPGAVAEYQKTANRPVGPPGPAGHLSIDFIAQRGRYADITSAVEGAEHLAVEDFYVVFADNVDPRHQALALLDIAPRQVPAVLATPFDASKASDHGVIVCAPDGRAQRMTDFVEKPGPEEVARLIAVYGVGSLRLLQGRMRVTSGLLAYLSRFSLDAQHEPKLSLAIADYARSHRTSVVTTTRAMVDLGLGHG